MIPPENPAAAFWKYKVLSAGISGEDQTAYSESPQTITKVGANPTSVICFPAVPVPVYEPVFIWVAVRGETAVVAGARVVEVEELVDWVVEVLWLVVVLEVEVDLVVEVD